MKILIIHFRSAPSGNHKQQTQETNSNVTDSAGTDGVSLEIMKRRNTLEAMGHKVAICSACRWADFPIEAMEFDSEETMEMMLNLFRPAMTDFTDETDLKRAFDISCLKLKQELASVVEDFKPDMLFVHNILCLPIHPAATVALADLLREAGLPCAAIHHDIISEGAYKFTPTCNFAKEILSGYFPPVMPNLKHWTINSRNQKSLKERGIKAEIIHDTMDFDQKLASEERDRLRTTIRSEHGIKPHDIVLLFAARIVPNKQIEIAGHLMATLQDLRQEIIGKKLYHGEIFAEESRIVLVLVGRPERAFADYQERLFDFFNGLKIPWIYLGDEVRPLRSDKEGFYALYPDMYSMADFVLYPSGWEGFGNQLLEAFVADLPVVVFEYPVFKEDIAPKGVEVVSLGDTLLEERDSRGLVGVSSRILTRAAREMITILTTRDRYQEITAHNNIVSKKYFSFDVLRDHLRSAINWATSSMFRDSINQ